MFAGQDARSILEELEEHFNETIDDYQNGHDFDDFSCDLPEDVYKIELVQRRGGEGQGEEYWMVFKITSGPIEVFIRWEGCYNSWEGTEWDTDPKVVLPHERTIIEYY